MKIKLPVVLRSTYERETSELVKDIKVQESAKSSTDKKVKNLKLKLERHDYLAELKEKEQAEEISKLKLQLEKKR